MLRGARASWLLGSAAAAGGAWLANKQVSAKFDPGNWKPYELSEVFPVSHDTKRFRFKLESDSDEMGMTTASCIVTGFKDADGKMVVRPYTPTTRNVEKGYFDLVVKCYPDGKMGTHMFNMKAGDTLDVKGPYAKLAYKPNMKKRIGMVAGGSGLTPMLQILREIAADKSDETVVDFVFANRTPADIILKEELDRIAKSRSNIRIHYIVDKADGSWKGREGHVSPGLLKELMPAPSGDSSVYVCGPPGMMKAVSGEKDKNKEQGELSGMLKDLGYNESQVYKF